MEIQLKDCYFNSDYTVRTKNSKGTMAVTIEKINENTFYPKYSVSITTDIDTYVRKDIGTPEESPLDLLISTMLEQNMSIKVHNDKGEVVTDFKKYGEPREGIYTITFNKLNTKRTKIMEALKTLPSTESDLRFCKFGCVTDSKIVVEYYGHEVAGSYTYDYEVTPAYEAYLSTETNRVTKWTKNRRSGGFGSDIYEFEVLINKVCSKEQEDQVVKGVKYHIDSTVCGSRQSPYAFRTCPGIPWAMMYALAEKGAKLPDITQEGSVILHKGDPILNILVEPWEKRDNRPNRGRTHYKGTFDLYITKKELQNVYLDVVATQESKDVAIVHPSCTSPYVRIGVEDSRKIGYL